MKIGIIGAGMIGGTLARRLTALGHEVVIATSRGPETLREFAAETGVRAVTVAEGARGGEIVIVTIPQRAVPELPGDLFAGVPEDVVVVDTGNYYPARDGRIDAIEDGQAESAWVAEHLGRPVVKVFNNIASHSLLENGTVSGPPASPAPSTSMAARSASPVPAADRSPKRSPPSPSAAAAASSTSPVARAEPPR